MCIRRTMRPIHVDTRLCNITICECIINKVRRGQVYYDRVDNMTGIQWYNIM